MVALYLFTKLKQNLLLIVGTLAIPYVNFGVISKFFEDYSWNLLA